MTVINVTNKTFHWPNEEWELAFPSFLVNTSFMNGTYVQEFLMCIFFNRIRYVWAAAGQIGVSFPRKMSPKQWELLIGKMLHFLIFLGGATGPSGPGPPHSRGFWITHNDAPQSVGLLWTSDQLVAKTSTWHHTTRTTNTHAPPPQWDSNPQYQQASGRRIRP